MVFGSTQESTQTYISKLNKSRGVKLHKNRAEKRINVSQFFFQPFLQLIIIKV